jgi:hypothetical protein
VWDEKAERLEEIREGVERYDFPEFFLKPGEGGLTEENLGESLEKKGCCDALN